MSRNLTLKTTKNKIKSMAQFGGKRQTNQLDARCRELENELEEERKRQTDSQKGTGEIVN